MRHSSTTTTIESRSTIDRMAAGQGINQDMRGHHTIDVPSRPNGSQRPSARTGALDALID